MELLGENENRQEMEGCYLGSGVGDVALGETRELVFVLLLGFKELQVG